MKMLCERCSEIFRGTYPTLTYSYENPGQRHHHYSIQDLEKAAFERCYICRVLWRAVSSQTPDDEGIHSADVASHTNVSPKHISRYYFESHFSYIPRILGLYFEVDRHGMFDNYLEFAFLLHNGRDAHKLLDQPRPARSLAWCEALKTATDWLFVCERDHEKCSAAIASNSYVPKRLLHISRSDATKVKLVVNPGAKLGPIRYATVSHCWGSSKPLTLTSNSFAMLQAGIKIAKLPQNFKDAIYASNCIGIEYIWIDSLCIFQDSKEDWTEQAPQMSHVYRNGIINIALNAASNCDETCFLERDLSLITPCTVKTEWDDHPNGEFHIYNFDAWDDVVDNKPLTARAWTLQEFLLPSRILHLTGEELAWECFELSACETYPYELPPSFQGPSPSSLSREIIWKALLFSEDGNQKTEYFPKQLVQKEIRELWASIIRRYTQLSLTVSSDRLIALAGVARIMAQALNDKYCAGLWRENLVRELCWQCEYQSDLLKPRPTTYRAPSWSWAGSDAACSLSHLYFSTNIEMIRIVDCRVDTAADDPFGFVNAGTLSVRGWLATMDLTPVPDRNIRGSCYFNGLWWDNEVQIYFDCVLPHSRLHCLPVLRRAENGKLRELQCVLLIATGDQKGQFQRAGMLYHYHQDIEQFEDAFTNPKNEDWFEFETEYEDGTYQISIV